MLHEVTPRPSVFHVLRAIVAICPAVLALGCGGKEPAESAADQATTSEAKPESAGTSEPASPAKAATPEVVTTCEEKGKLCLPPAAYVKKLCENGSADLALVYFKKGSPFTRAYLRGATDAWNASGGGSSSENKFVFDEEVIVLLERSNTTGIQVSGAGASYDVMRWDGSCASLSAEEITFSVAPKPKNPTLKWKTFSEETQNAMLGDANIAKLNKERRNECKGVDVGTVSLACVKLVDKLSEAIVTYIRNGGEVPVPKSLK